MNITGAELFELFLTETNDFVYLKDIEHRFIATSNAFANLAGFNHYRELTGKTDFDIFEPDLAQQYYEQERKVVGDGVDLVNHIEPYRKLDGQLGYVASNKRPMRNAQNEIIGCFGISRDITESMLSSTDLNARNEVNAQRIEALERYVDQQSKALADVYLSAMTAMLKLQELRDDKTGLHLHRVSLMSMKLAELVKRKHREIDSEYISAIGFASTTHDIGKVAIPDVILLKKGKLTEEEFEIVTTHTTEGRKAFDLIEGSRDNLLISLSRDIILCHHERFDGTGYPNRLNGEEIPIAARIVTIVDVYDALRSERPYKSALTHEDAIEIMRVEKGHFDPYILRTFLKHEETFEKLFG